MSEPAASKPWTRMSFGEMAESVSERVEPTEADSEMYVGLEHLESGSLTVRRWGTDVPLIGTKLRMRQGDILFAKRNAYLRRVAVAPHDGLFSAHGMVLRPHPAVVHPEFLPFFMQSDLFMERAKEISVGSLSPTINWKTLASEEFVLPPLDEQRQIASVLQGCDRLSIALDDLRRSHEQVVAASLEQMLGAHEAESVTIGEVSVLVTNGFVGSAVKHYVSNGIPYLRSLNVRRSGMSFDDVVQISRSFHEATKKSQLREGDLLTVQSGHVGETAVVPAECENWNCHALILTRLDQSRALPQYVAMFLNSVVGQRKLARLYVGSTVAHLNTSDLTVVEIPLPEMQQQEDIVRKMTALNVAADRIQERMTELEAVRKQIVSRLLEPSVGE